MPVLSVRNRLSWTHDYSERNRTTTSQSRYHSALASSQVNKRSTIIRGIGRILQKIYQELLPKSSSAYHHYKTQEIPMERLSRGKLPDTPNSVTLKLPNMTQEFNVTTDASDIAIGAVLEQHDENKVLRPVAFLSKTLNSAEKNYPLHERELLALVHAIGRWRVYLYGNKFTVYTDHAPLQYITSQKHLYARQIRWIRVCHQI